MSSNYFFEIADKYVEKYPSRYVCIFNVNNMYTSYWPMIHSDRVWRECDDKVYFVKNRYYDIYDSDTIVDLNEFIWIKLKSHDINATYF